MIWKSWGKLCEIHGFWAMLPWHRQFRLFPSCFGGQWPVQFPKTPAAAVVPDEVLGHMTHVPVVLS
jgi:hypothetical protein